ncbi:S-adenosyl-L-methionine-dependent methyltransferase [Aulographum hederae CBS 113979]|uniref:S-adenosyl-L-methionine-dependent methyltransferase n=1 Tax=Aulographum hederae CBS 113979 TaxID=1176131 RepID=A0A6G1GRZ6_9PEZI|nr:S-adenosyl-L-methionine-dependent methyltransferase [Aulographum hederae CBS 113979]
MGKPSKAPPPKQRPQSQPKPPSKPAPSTPQLSKAPPKPPKPQPTKSAYVPIPQTPRTARPLPPPRFSHPENAARIGRHRRLPLILSSITALGLGFYVTSIYTSATRPSTSTLPPSADLTPIYDTTAALYDASVAWPERLMGMTWLRKSLARRAEGDVLEASVGTGRNARWYDGGRVRSLTCVDRSEGMLEVARGKWESRCLEEQGVGKGKGKVAARPGVIEEKEEQGYDTVLQTMGLCSTPTPTTLLQNLGRLVKPSSGKILLLEHGRSYYDWLNRLLDLRATDHAERHGCWWNRDIEAIVEESGLELVNLTRYHFGTTYWVELKPGRMAVDSGREGERKVATVSEHVVEEKKPLWRWRMWWAE